MRIRVFGQAVITHGNAEPAALGPRPQIVLARLVAAEGRLVSDDQLVDAIWGAEPPKSTRTALHGYILTIRNAMEPDRPKGGTGNFVLRTSNSYRLAVNSPEHLDLAEYTELSTAPRPRTVDQLDRLIELTSSQVFDGYEDHEWAAPIRAGVLDGRADALTERFAAELTTGTGAPLLSTMRGAHAEFEFNEQIAVQLMTALYRCGRQQEALEVYGNVRRRLVDELGVSPSAQLEAHHLAVLEQSAELDAAPGRTPTAAPGTATPTRTTSNELLARHGDISAITDVLLSDRTVTITGAGGVGKSTVTREVVAHVAHKFASTPAVDVSSVANDGLVDAVATALGVELAANASLSDAIDAVYGTASILVVLDTCEVASTEVAAVTNELLALSSVHVLLAARAPVGHRQERRYRLESLSTEAAVELLMRSAVDSEVDHDALRTLATRLDGLPLALEMAGARVASLGVDTVLDELGRLLPLDAGRSADPDAPERHQSTTALVDWSLQLLDAPQSALLARLAALPGDIPLAALTELPPLDNVPPDAVPSVLGDLVDASLVNRTAHTPTRFRLLDTVASAVEQRHPNEVEAQRNVVANHVSAAAFADYTGTGASTVGTWIADQFEPSLQHLLATPDARGLMLATAAARAWIDRGELRRGRRALETVLGSNRALPAPLVSIGSTILGYTQLYQGDLQTALASYRTSLSLADQVPSPGYASLIEATVAWLECDFERSWAVSKAAMEAIDMSNRRSPGNLVSFAKSAIFAGDLDGAEACYEHARELAESFDDNVAAAEALRLSAVVHSMRDRHDDAWRNAQRAVALHDTEQAPMGAAQAAAAMALIAAQSGDEARAQRWVTTAFERALRQFDTNTAAVGIPVRAWVDVRSGRLERAARLYGWLDNFVDEQRHVHHPTAARLHDAVHRVFSEADDTELRAWRAEGAALSTMAMLQLAVSNH